MNYKDYMNWLKENDPMLYSDLTSNPTGAGSDGESVGCFVFLIIGFICFLIFLAAK